MEVRTGNGQLTVADGGEIMTAALLAALALWPFHPAQTVTRSYLIPAWHVDATRDRFTGRMICRVYQGSRARPTVAFERQTLAFRFAHRLDTTRAEFQVDASPVRSWTAVYPTLIGSGATLSNTSMRNPTGGLVILPAAMFKDASIVVIRATPRRRPVTFAVGGLQDAFTSARRLGCDADYGFAR